MASITELEDAFLRADEAGDTESAQMFADEIQRIKSQEQGDLSGAVKAFAQGATFGFSDEALAALKSALGDKTYEEAVAEEREQLERFRASSPKTAIAAEIAGQVPYMFIPALGGTRIAQTAAKLIPQAAKPVTAQVTRRAAARPVATAGLLGAGQGALYGAGVAGSEEGETLKGAVGGGLLGGALGGTLGAALPKATETAKKFVSEGVPLTIGQTRGGALRAMEDLAEFLPFIGRSVSAAKGRALDEYSRVPVNAVMSRIGGAPLPKGATGNSAVAHMKSEVNKAYNAVKPELSLSNAKDDVLPAITETMKSISKGQVPDVFITKESSRLAQKFLDDEVIPRLNKNVVQGEDWFQLDKMLSKKINKTFKSAASTDADRGMAEALSIIQREFRRASKEVNRSGVLNYEKIDNVYPLVASIKSAAGKKAAGLADGSFTPDELVGAMATKQKPRFETGAAMGQREAVEAAEALGRRQDAALRPYLEGSRLAGAAGLGVGGSMGLLSPLIAGGLAAIPAYSRVGVPVTREVGGAVADFARQRLPALAGGAMGSYIGEPAIGLLGQE